MSQPPGNWNVPPPPPGARPRQPIRGSRVMAGIGIALLGHFLSISVLLTGALIGDADLAANAGLLVMLLGQAIVFIGCLVAGIILTVRQDGGAGVGLLIGWAIGVLIAPVVGFGVCAWAYSNTGTFG